MIGWHGKKKKKIKMWMEKSKTNLMSAYAAKQI